MKRLISLFLCVALFSPLLLISASAEQAITKTEAAELITKMNGFHLTLRERCGDIDVEKLGGTEVTDKETFDRLLELIRFEPNDDLVFYLLDGDYGKPSFWYDHIGKFLTDDYIQNNVQFNWAIFMLDDKMYRVDSLFYLGPPVPSLIPESSLDECIKVVDSDTVLLKADYMNQEQKWLPIDFEYTENGWRISGGEGAEQFMYFASVRDTENPETDDGVTVIIACLAVSMLGVGITVRKRRYMNIT